MQLFVRNLRSCSTSIEVDMDEDIRKIKDIVEVRLSLSICFSSRYLLNHFFSHLIFQEREGIPADEQVLVYGTKLLREGYTIKDYGLVQHSTLHLSCRLLGGKPVKVKMMTSHLPCGQEVTIDIESTATKEEIKKKLQDATGVPVEHQKVMLAGINQIVMGDKRYVDFATIAK